MKLFFSFSTLVVALVAAIPTSPWNKHSPEIASATSVALEGPIIIAGDLNEDRSLFFRRAIGRTKCSPSPGQPNVEGIKLLKRLVGDYNVTNNVGNYSILIEKLLEDRHLSKRVMTVPSAGASEAEFNSWYTNEMMSSQGAVYDQTVSTAQFKNIQNTAMSFGISGLCGCTTLVIYSKKAVYIGHYFENLSFDPDADAQHGSDNGFTPEQAFENTVITALEKGIKPSRPGATDGQDTLAGRAVEFGGEGTKAWLIIPAVGQHEDPDPYRKQWNEMRDVIKKMYPKITYSEHVYNPLDKAKRADVQLLRDTARGKMLWKYDPLDPESGAREAPHQLIKLWSEYTELDAVRF